MLFSPLFYLSACAQLATVVADTTAESPALASVRLVCVAQPATGVAGKTYKCAALVSVRLVGMGSASHWGGGEDS